MDKQAIQNQVMDWLTSVVVGLNLCPFARAPLAQDRIRFVVSESDSQAGLLADLLDELEHLVQQPQVETTLLIHPVVLNEFDEYNQFLDIADALLEQQGWTGTFQIASFHPGYQFAGTRPDDVENFTNRSPYPILHLLREESVSSAISRHPDVESIPSNNIRQMQRLGFARLTSLFNKFYRE